MTTKTIAAAAKLTLLTALCAPLGMGSALAQDNEVAEQDQTMLDVRFVTTKYGVTNNIDMSQAKYTLVSGQQALSIITDFYADSELWDSQIMTYTQVTLSRPEAVAIVVDHKSAAPMVIVPWDANDTPSFESLPADLAYTQLGYIVPLDEGFVDMAEGCKNTGRYGDLGSGVTCACLNDMGCADCTTCADPIFDGAFKPNACKTDGMNVVNFEIGHTLPIYCF